MPDFNANFAIKTDTSDMAIGIVIVHHIIQLPYLHVKMISISI